MSSSIIQLTNVLTPNEYHALDKPGRKTNGTLAGMAEFLADRFALNISFDPDIATDSSNLPGRADALCRPANERECAAVMRACFCAGIPMTITSGQSNLTGSATAEGGMVIALDRMTTPEVAVDREKRLVTTAVLRLAPRPAAYLDLFFSLSGEAEALKFQDYLYRHLEGYFGRLAALEYFGVNCRRYMDHENRLFHGDNQVAIYLQVPLDEKSQLETAIEEWFNLLLDSEYGIKPEKANLERATELYDLIIARSAELGSVYSSEHGTGKRKRKNFISCFNQEALEQVRRCKAAVDPDFLLNRGNVFKP